MPRRKRPVMFKLTVDDDHPLADKLWKHVEAGGHGTGVPSVLVNLYYEDEVQERNVSLEDAAAIQNWCIALPWWPEKGPAPLKWERLVGYTPEVGGKKASILVPMTLAERDALNAEAQRLGMTQKELARRKLLAPYQA